MFRTSAPLAGAFAAALLVASAPAAQAAVKAKDVPSENDIVKAFPALAGGTFTPEKTKTIGKPSSTCGQAGQEKVKSGATMTGVSSAGTTVVVTGAAELKSPAKSKKYVASYKKFVKACSSYTEPTTGATITMKLTKAPKLGQQALAVVQETTVFGVTSYGATVLVRDGKRIATVAAVDQAAVSSSAINKLAKVAAKKMK